MPVGFITQEGSKIYTWKPVAYSVIDKAHNSASALELSKDIIKKLLRRYEIIEKWIQEKKIISAKDTSALCPMKSLFEMCLGRKKGIHFLNEHSHEELCTQSSTLGGFHLVFSQNFEFEKEVPPEFQNEIMEMGLTTSKFEFVLKDQTLNLESFRNSYLKGSDELWA
jgi:phosphoribosylformylglycinamidine (FGAM) synthase-like enzyme